MTMKRFSGNFSRSPPMKHPGLTRRPIQRSSQRLMGKSMTLRNHKLQDKHFYRQIVGMSGNRRGKWPHSRTTKRRSKKSTDKHVTAISTSKKSESEAVNLSDLDDISTFLVVDPVLEFKTHKMEVGYYATHKIPETKIKSDLKRICLNFMTHINYDRILLEISTVIFAHSLEVPDEIGLLEYLKTYLRVLDPTSGCEILPCTRYSGDGEIGAKICSTRIWQSGDVIKAIVGYYGPMTNAESESMIRAGQNDFSIIMTSRPGPGQQTRLFLGPAAFVNHDCDPNSEYYEEDPKQNDKETKGSAHVSFRAIRAIGVGEEITVKYSNFYFGKFNKECECPTCEMTEKSPMTRIFGNTNYALRKTYDRMVRTPPRGP